MWQKDEDVPEIAKWAKNKQTNTFLLKELCVIFHNIESTKHKMLEADTDLDTFMTVCQD